MDSPDHDCKRVLQQARSLDYRSRLLLSVALLRSVAEDPEFLAGEEAELIRTVDLTVEGFSDQSH